MEYFVHKREKDGERERDQSVSFVGNKRVFLGALLFFSRPLKTHTHPQETKNKLFTTNARKNERRREEEREEKRNCKKKQRTNIHAIVTYTELKERSQINKSIFKLL